MSTRTPEEVIEDWERNHFPAHDDRESRFYIQREGGWDWIIVDRQTGLQIVAFPWLNLHEARGAAKALNAFATQAAETVLKGKQAPK